VGKHVRLEGLDASRHLLELYNVTSGLGETTGTRSYDPNNVWGFVQDGPFRTSDDMYHSFLFRPHRPDGAGFAIVDNVTDRVGGVVRLVDDEPHHLSIQLEPPIVAPDRDDGSLYQIESCYLLLDRLFGYGYRRIEMRLDTGDTRKKKLCTRLGFTSEGVLYRHMILLKNNTSRDTIVYSMLNNDWYKGGARTALYKKIYGGSMFQADMANEVYEQEQDEKKRHLQKQQRTVAAPSLVVDDRTCDDAHVKKD
jgi:RimJ/RimL family protein N-acetyltransferase